MKIVSFIKDSSRLLLDGFKRFPITYILIAILAVAFEININNSSSNVFSLQETKRNNNTVKQIIRFILFPLKNIYIY